MAKLLGKTEPRIWTRPLRPLTPETSLGFEAVEFSEDYLGRPLHPWQKWFLIHSMELAPGSHTSDEYPTFRFKQVILLVARQNGKSYIMSTRLLWRMIMWDGPEIEDPLILGVAHKLPAAKEILQLAHKALTRSEKLHNYLVKLSNTNGQEEMSLTNGSRYKIEAASDDGGRSLSVTDLGFDELRQQKEWSAWSALTNTTNAIHSSQVIGVSNAGEAKSDVLRSLRSRGIAEVEEYFKFVADGGAEEDWVHAREQGYATLGLFDYSAPDGASIWDREGWAQANPSLGYPHGPTEETIAALASLVGKPGEGIPEHKFRTENLCQWVALAVDGPFKEEELERCLDPESYIAEDSPISLAVDVSRDRSMGYVAVAGFRPDGEPHVEVIAKRAYTEWIPKYLSEELAFTPSAVVVQGRGAPASSIIPFIEDEGVTIDKCEGSDLPASCGQLSDRIVRGTLHWGEQPALITALKQAVQKKYGDIWSWDRDKSPVDIAPLCAATFALWGLYNVEREDKVSVYDEDYDGWWK